MAVTAAMAKAVPVAAVVDEPRPSSAMIRKKAGRSRRNRRLKWPERIIKQGRRPGSWSGV